MLKNSKVEQIRLDSIDEIDTPGQRIHCNEHGWFAMAGWPQEPDNQQKLLLKPGKTVLMAVCCGHQWRNQQRIHPRRLTVTGNVIGQSAELAKLCQTSSGENSGQVTIRAAG